MEGQWKCDVCKRLYACRRSLEIHMQAHAGEPQFQCKVCLRRFTFITNLYEHKSVHSKKLFECPFRNCKKTCRLKSNLKKHMKVHWKTVEELDEEYKKFTASLKKNKKQKKQRRQQKRQQRSKAAEDLLEVDPGRNVPENEGDDEPVNQADNVMEEEPEDAPSTSAKKAAADEPDHEVLGPARKRGKVDGSEPKKETEQPSTSSGVSCGTPSALVTHLSCCGLKQQLRFSTPVRNCDNNDTCRILEGAEYMCRKSRPESDNICLDCFDCADVKNQKLWTKRVNLNDKFEETVDCSKCGETTHKVCVFKFDETSFICGDCSGEPGFKKIIETDPNREIDVFLSDKANNQLDDKDGKISVASFTTSKSIHTKKLMPDLYLKDAKKKYGSVVNYVARAIYFFQIIDNISVAFFGLFTQEYQDLGGKSWCVIDYLDSIPYMKASSKSRSDVYLELILAYFEYMGLKGFKNGHLWANPPDKGVDYIFNIHPDTQRYLDKTGLIKWYRKILQLGKDTRRLADYRNFEGEFKKGEGEFKNPYDLPVFVDSLWCKILKWIEGELENPNDQNFKRMLENEYKERALDNFYFDLCGSQLQHPIPLQSEEFNPHKILGDRDSFLDKCFAENWEFSSLRRAKHSSVGIINLIEAAREEREVNGVLLVHVSSSSTTDCLLFISSFAHVFSSASASNHYRFSVLFLQFAPCAPAIVYIAPLIVHSFSSAVLHSHFRCSPHGKSSIYRLYALLLCPSIPSAPLFFIHTSDARSDTSDTFHTFDTSDLISRISSP